MAGVEDSENVVGSIYLGSLWVEGFGDFLSY